MTAGTCCTSPKTTENRIVGVGRRSRANSWRWLVFPFRPAYGSGGPGRAHRGPAGEREAVMVAAVLLAQDDGGAGGVLGGIAGMMCVVWTIGIIATVFWLWMLIDALMNEPTT